MVVFCDGGKIDVSEGDRWPFFGEMGWDMVLKISIFLHFCQLLSIGLGIREHTFFLNRPPSFLHVLSETNLSKLPLNFSGSSTSSNTFKLYSAILLYNGLSSQTCKGMTSSVATRAGATGLARNDMILRHEGSIGSVWWGDEV